MFIGENDDGSEINTIVTMKVFPDGCIGFDLGSRLHNSILSKRLDYGVFAPACRGSMFRVAMAYLETVYDVKPIVTPEFGAYCDPYREEVRTNKKRDDSIIKSFKQSLFVNTKTTVDEDEE